MPPGQQRYLGSPGHDDTESHLDNNQGQMLPGLRRWLDGDDVMRPLTNALLLCNYNILTPDSDDEVLLRPEQLQERHLDGARSN